MSDPVNIVITDSVSPQISVKIKGIASDARDASAAVTQLQAQLAALDNSSSLIKLQTALGGVKTQLTQLNTAQTQIVASTNTAATAQSALAKSSGEASQAAILAANAQMTFTKAQIDAANGTVAIEKAQKSAATAAAATTAANLKNRDSMAALDSELENFLTKNNKAYAAQKAFQEGQDLITRALQANLISQKAAGDAMAILQTKVDNIGKSSLASGGSTSFFTQKIKALGDELASGRYRQADGSFAALATRILGLGTASLIGVAGVAGLAVGFGLVIAKSEEIQRAINQVSLGFLSTGNTIILSKKQIEDYINTLALLPGVSRDAAGQTVAELSRIPFITKPQFDSLNKIVAQFAFATGITAPQAAKQLATSLEDPAKAAVDLTKKFDLLSVEQLLTVQALDKTGDKAGAVSVIVQALAARFQNAIVDGTTPMQKAANDLVVAWDSLVRSFSNDDGTNKATTSISNLLKNITDLVNYMREKKDEVAKFFGEFLKFAQYSPQLNLAIQTAKLAMSRNDGPKGGNSVSGQLSVQTFKPSNDYGDAVDRSGEQAQDEQLKQVILRNAALKSSQDEIKQLIADENTLTAAVKSGTLSTIARQQALSEIAAIREKIARIHPPKDVAGDALKKENLQLDDELKRMNELQPLREKDAAYDKIKESLKTHKVDLESPVYAAQAAAIRKKSDALVDNKLIQKDFDKINEDSLGPLRDYNNMLTAAKMSLDKGYISQTQYNGEVARARDVYANALDPIRTYTKSLNDQLSVFAQLPRDQQAEQLVIEARNKLLSEGKILTDAQADSLRNLSKVTRDANEANTAQNALLADSVDKRRQFQQQTDAISKLKANPKSGFTQGDADTAVNSQLTSLGFDATYLKNQTNANVDKFQEMYKKIDALRQADLISEEDAAGLKTQVWAQQQSSQLTGVSTFLGNIAQLQKSQNSKVAAVGKAAAISGALIDTYKAATGAYASLASIPYVGPFLGAAAAAAAIAAGIANVAQIRAQPTGFQTGGYTGDFPVDQTVGQVHGKEYVFDAASTNRIGVANLESLRRGAQVVAANKPTSTPRGVGDRAASGRDSSQRGENAPGVVVNHRSINVLDPNLIAAYLATPEGETSVINVISRNSDTVRSVVS